MNFFAKTTGIVCLMLASAAANADTLASNMDKLSMGLSMVKSAQSQQQMAAGLDKMQQAANASMHQRPAGMEALSADNAEVKAYQAGIQQLLDQIQVVQQLNQQNKLKEAQQAVTKILAIRNENHRKFR